MRSDLVEKKWVVRHDCRGMTTNEIIDTILQDREVENINTLLNPDEDCLIPFESNDINLLLLCL